ncbi:MAG TPA: phosphatase PAP2 family protein [Rhizomicrobium sp.]|nr:phosphatase PAP2 family protein [Rhizomicrobium sp.]
MRIFCATALAALLAFAGSAEAFTPNTTPLTSSEKHIETAGTVVSIALPVAAAAIAWRKNDIRLGWTELLAETVLTVGTAYGLKHLVHEERPNGRDDQSFPSDTTALAASGSSFLWGRYGWEYGLPATLATGCVGYSRIQARDHRWYDTAASLGISALYGYVVTTPFQRRYKIRTELMPLQDGAYLRVSYNW